MDCLLVLTGEASMILGILRTPPLIHGFTLATCFTFATEEPLFLGYSWGSVSFSNRRREPLLGNILKSHERFRTNINLSMSEQTTQTPHFVPILYSNFLGGRQFTTPIQHTWIDPGLGLAHAHFSRRMLADAFCPKETECCCRLFR